MSNQQNYFSIGNKLFWGLILLLVLFALLKLNPGIFKGDNIARDIIVADSLSKINWNEVIVLEDSITINKDSTVIPRDEYLTRVWKWESFNGKNYELNFKVKKNDYQTSINNRNTSNSQEGELYREMFNTDNVALINMIAGYKKLISENGLDYYDGLNMIITSIQSIHYTYVLINNPSCGLFDGGSGKWMPPENCTVSVSPCGCCDNVLPWAVFSPVEFATNRTGDCDTRSLFAYTVLKKMGYDVAVMVSNSQAHSVLGLLVPNVPSDGKRGNIGLASNYFLWELTTYGPQLGQRIDGNDWRIALN